METTMRNHLLVLTASAFVLASGAASAQQGKGSGALTTPESTTQSGMTGHGDSTDMAAWHRSMGYGSPHGHMGHSPMMQMVFILADTNGDGKLSLQEFQAAHERMFKAMDSNKDGGLTLEEMQFFVHGSKD
jgi:hypothetical protein